MVAAITFKILSTLLLLPDPTRSANIIADETNILSYVQNKSMPTKTFDTDGKY